MSRNGLSIKDTRKSISSILEADEPENRLPILLRGDFGVGKSDLVYQIGEEMGFDDEHIVERRASQMVEGDLIGMPDTLTGLSLPAQVSMNWLLERVDGGEKTRFAIENAPNYIQEAMGWFLEGDDLLELGDDLFNLLEIISGLSEDPYTQWKPPEWLYKACQEPCLLFFDEVDRAMVSVRQGLFELTGSRRLYGNELHKGTYIFAAINGGEGVTDYSVGEMDPAEQDRWFTIEFHPTTEEWMDWARRNDVNELIIEYISDNPDDLEMDPNDGWEPGAHYPSRRSWDRFSRQIDEKYPNGRKPDPEWVFLHGIGQVGRSTAQRFAEFVRNYEESYSIDDVLNDDTGEIIREVLEKSYTTHNKVCKQFGSKYTGEELEENQIRNLAAYMFQLDDEIAMSLFKTVTDRDCREDLFDVKPEEVPVEVDGDYEEFGDYILEIYESDKELRDVEAFGEEDEENEEESSD